MENLLIYLTTTNFLILLLLYLLSRSLERRREDLDETAAVLKSWQDSLAEIEKALKGEEDDGGTGNKPTSK